jgi:chromosome partitioning protein
VSVPVIAFFNNKGGVGKTSLVYHLAWMYADKGLRVLAADLDPQANLTAAFLEEEEIEELWESDEPGRTVFGCVKPLKDGLGDIADPQLRLADADGRLALLPGDLQLTSYEDQLSEVWPKCLDRDQRAFRVTSAFWRVTQKAAQSHQADLVLVDLGPNLGAINRAVLVGTDYVVVPLAPDLFSLQGLRNLGPALRKWRSGWQERKKKNPVKDLGLPEGSMDPVGYVVMQHSVRLDRPTRAYDRWVARIPEVYRTAVTEQRTGQDIDISNDPNCLALLKHYRSLMPMAQEARKPMFSLKPADGAIGSHSQSAQGAYRDFALLAEKIAAQAKVRMP